MARHFNTAGPCEAHKHYMLPPADRLRDLRPLIDREAYFVIHAPRQTGKTTFIQWLADDLTAEGKYAAVVVNCKPAATAGDDVERGVDAVIRAIHDTVCEQLSEELRPETPETVAGIECELRLIGYLRRWCKRSPRPVVLMLDEIDAMRGGALLSVLNQLSAGYTLHPAAFPHSLALIGLRDVRDYKIKRSNGRGYAGTSSPFNIKSDSLRMRDFTAEEVATLYEQHTAETGQPFADEVKVRAFELTRGQPWLVNALARQLVEEEAPDPGVGVEMPHLEAAKEALIQRRDTHLDSLIDRLHETRVRGVIGPILAGCYLESEVMDDDVQFTEDLGLVVAGDRGLEIANPIYREIIPRALTALLEKQLQVATASWIGADGRLLFDRFLDEFRSFWLANAEFFLQRQPYSEAAAELIFMAYLHKLVNGEGRRRGAAIEREFAVGSGRVDLMIRWPLPSGEVERFAVELKVWSRDRDPDPLEEGLVQLNGYLDRLGLAAGTLILFDRRPSAPALPERSSRRELSHEGRQITVLRL